MLLNIYVHCDLYIYAHIIQKKFFQTEENDKREDITQSKSIDANKHAALSKPLCTY